MIVDYRLILYPRELTEQHQDRIKRMQADYDLQYPDNMIILKAIKVCGCVCVAEFSKFQEMAFDIVTPLNDDGTRRPKQRVKLEFAWDTNGRDIK